LNHIFFNFRKNNCKSPVPPAGTRAVTPQRGIPTCCDLLLKREHAISIANPQLMPEPIVFQKSPIVQKVEPGTYWWCACGRSRSQPFCDGSHKGTGLEPKQVEIKEAKTVAWCACKHSKAMPFCDGSHSKLP
jgi:CDGSH-type Zn-finger protein